MAIKDCDFCNNRSEVKKIFKDYYTCDRCMRVALSDAFFEILGDLSDAVADNLFEKLDGK